MIRLIIKDGTPGQISLKPSFLLIHLSIALSSMNGNFIQLFVKFTETQKIAIKILNELRVGSKGKC